MRPAIRLLRPGNAIMSAIAVGVGGVVAVGASAAVERSPALALGGAAVFLFTGAGNALNDFFDREIDRANHPDRPIPSGWIAPRAAFDLALALFVAAIVASVFVNLAALALVLVSLFLMIAYEVRFKASGWSGNLLIGWLVGSLFLFAGLCVSQGASRPVQIAGSLALLAGLSTVGREIMKDVEDVAGDVGRTTLPKVIGIPLATRVARTFTVAAVMLSIVPAVLGILGLGYIAIVVVADAIFIAAALYSATSPGRAERLMKVAMVVALVAFLAGGLR